MAHERPGGRAGKVALAAGVVIGVVAVVAAALGWSTTRPTADSGRSAVQVAAAPGASPVSDPPDSAAPVAQLTVQALPPAAGTAGRPEGTVGRPAQGGSRRPAGMPLTSTSAAAPARIDVPALGVSAEVDAVGVEPDGSMTVPARPDRVGWYRWGPAPGRKQGSTVLAGHVDTARDGPGAFAALVDAEVGQDVVVTLGDGTEVAYRVEGRELVTKRELPVDVLFARDGPARLTLVTCGGPFQPELRSYRDNVVVTALPVVPP